MKELLIFDLDGTLIDSKRDLADSVNAMRVHLGEPLLADETVYSYVGNGVAALVQRALPGRDEEEVERGLRFVVFCSMEIAGLRPSMESTSGRSI